MTGHLKASPPERYEEISRHLLEQAQEELDKGDILQASDKVWGATAHAVKAVCQRMGWNHHAHNHISAAANYAASGLNRYDLMEAFGFLEAMHINYYEHQKEADQVRLEVDRAVYFIDEFAALSFAELPGDQSHLSPLEQAGQARRLRMLTRKNQYSHGPQFSPEEAASLPPVNSAAHVPGEN
jgi:hypothetical protein